MSGNGGAGGPIRGAEEATPEWLTQALRRSGAVSEERVVRRSVTRTLRTRSADVYWLALEYESGGPPPAPAALILKVARADAPAAGAAKKIAFYRLVAPEMPGFPAPRCFDLAAGADGREWHLFLEDVSVGRHQPPYNLPPTEPICALAVECLARLHAAWWQHARLDRDLGQLPTQSAVDEADDRAERMVGDFLEFLGDRLSAARRTV